MDTVFFFFENIDMFSLEGNVYNHKTYTHSTVFLLKSTIININVPFNYYFYSDIQTQEWILKNVKD